MSDTSYPSSSEELSGVSGGEECGPCQNVPGAGDVLCGPPLSRDRFERACQRVYASGPLSLRVTVNFNTGERSVYEVVPYPRDTLHWVWDFLHIFQLQEARDFVALRGHRRVPARRRNLGPCRTTVTARRGWPGDAVTDGASSSAAREDAPHWTWSWSLTWVSTFLYF